MDKCEIAAAKEIIRWERDINEHPLPKWEQLPEIGLYMDQVVILISRYLEFLNVGQGQEGEIIISPSIINNYVRLKLVPPPVKKKYSREHIAYIIMICAMKQGVNIKSISEILPPWGEGDGLQCFYDEFTVVYEKTGEYFARQARETSALLTDILADKNVEAYPAAVMIASVAASMSKLLAERIINDFTKRSGEIEN